MTARDDFSPIVEQGELPPGSGLRLRARRRPELGPLDAGFVRVLVGDDGSMIAEHARTGGERQWSRPRSWIKIDVGDHTLEYEVPFFDPTGRIELKARVSVRASVCDPTEVAARGIVSVKKDLESAIQEVVYGAVDATKPVRERDAVSALNESRRRAEVSVRSAARGTVPDVPRWLDAKFLSVSVSLDGATSRQRADLVGSEFKGQKIDAEALNDAKSARAEAAIRAIWRDELLPYLSDPTQRVFEVAFADPSRENLARAVDQVSGAELRLLSEGFELLQTMVEKDYVDKDDPFYTAIVAMSGKLAHLYLPGAATALAGPGATPELPNGDGTADDDVADYADADAQDGDRDFRD